MDLALLVTFKDGLEVCVAPRCTGPRGPGADADARSRLRLALSDSPRVRSVRELPREAAAGDFR